MMDTNVAASALESAEMSPDLQHTEAAKQDSFGAIVLAAAKRPASWRYPLLLAVFCCAAGWVMTRQLVVLIPASVAFLAAYGINVLSEENFRSKEPASTERP